MRYGQKLIPAIIGATMVVTGKAKAHSHLVWEWFDHLQGWPNEQTHLATSWNGQRSLLTVDHLGWLTCLHPDAWLWVQVAASIEDEQPGKNKNNPRSKQATDQVVTSRIQYKIPTYLGYDQSSSLDFLFVSLFVLFSLTLLRKNHTK